jgi:DMSO reductase anchor subunit
LAAIGGFVMVAIYLALIVSEGNNEFTEVAPWALAMFVGAALSLLATITQSDQRARMLLLVSAVLSLAIGVVSIFSSLGWLSCCRCHCAVCGK